MPKDFWSKKQIDTLRHMYELERKSWEDISAVIGRTPWACRSKMHELRAGTQSDGGRRAAGIGTQHSMIVKPEILADRDAREQAALRRTQTQEFFGDPPPGFSALDKKRTQQQGARS
jgi:hypothetical protein